jgi:osmotically-inducible protein OsmY
VNAGLVLDELPYSADVASEDNGPQIARSSLVVEVERALRATGYLSLRNLQIVQHGSAVILQGRVPTYHLKQLAQAIAMTHERVAQVYNEIDVISRANA